MTVTAAVEQRFNISGDTITVTLPSGPTEFPIVGADPVLLDWIREGRRGLYEALRTGNVHKVRFFAQHLPMCVTYNADSPFPFNCGNKGVGHLPRPELLEEYTERYRETHEFCKGKAWDESLVRRAETVSSFNLSPEVLDERCLVTLEIFEKGTYRNLTRYPLASLLYTGHSPSFVSYQVNCVVEVIGPDDPRYVFATLARTMFEYEEFHITQHAFPHAYVFWITECRDKTPYRTIDNAEYTALRAGTTMPWDDEALQALGRAPGLIRDHIKRLIEVFARDRGFDHVTEGVVAEAKENLMDGR